MFAVQVYVIVVSCVTVGLWCANSVLQKWVLCKVLAQKPVKQQTLGITT
jgi:hypothetical protein